MFRVLLVGGINVATQWHVDTTNRSATGASSLGGVHFSVQQRVKGPLMMAVTRTDNRRVRVRVRTSIRTVMVSVFGREWACFPKVIVFDVDETLWPFWIDTHTTPPYRRDEASGKIKDSTGKIMQLFEETELVLTSLRTVPGLQIGYASRTGEPSWMEELAKLVKFDVSGVNSSMWDLPDYREIYPGSKIKHFKNIAKQSG